MLVIHGLWAYGALQVWAEDSARPAQAPPRAGRPSRAPRPHPFAVAPGELADALAGAGAGDMAGKAVDDELTLRLPSVADGPLASPELVRPSTEAAAETPAAKRVALAAWRVPVLVFEPAAATALLPALADLASFGPAVGELVTDESASVGPASVGVASREVVSGAGAVGPAARALASAAPASSDRRTASWPSAGRSAIWPRSRGSPTTWSRGGGCCPR